MTKFEKIRTVVNTAPSVETVNNLRDALNPKFDVNTSSVVFDPETGEYTILFPLPVLKTEKERVARVTRFETLLDYILPEPLKGLRLTLGE